MKKKLTTVLAIVLVVALSVAGTYAYLTDKTDKVTNTFTVGNVGIDLKETFNTDADNDGTNDCWKMQLIPGTSAMKDPTVTVKANSEKCYLFVKFEENNNPAAYLSYTSTLTEADGWKKLDVESNVWYREVEKASKDTSFALLKADENGKMVTVRDTVTNDNMKDAAKAELAYTAYACQSEGMTVDQAWAAVNK